MADDFIEKFHKLEGTLLKEKKKSLFLLLDSYKSFHLDENILKEINRKLTPKTYLEEIYKLEFLLYFRRSSELLEILKAGNDVAASKIIRQSWFMEKLFKDMACEEFVQNVFPQLSIVVRAKILKQILKLQTEQCINALFDCLLGEYGLKPAAILLSGCSSDKIKEILLKRGLKLSKYQLKLLYDKDPSLISFFYEEFHRRGGSIHELANFSKYLSHKDPSLYVQLLLKYKFYPTTMGRRATKHYVFENKKAILEDPQKYLDSEIFLKTALVRGLGADFQKFLTSAVPKKLSDLLYSKAFDLINCYPKRKRYSLYRKVFEDVYKKNLFENKQFITHNLLEVIQDAEEREKWVEKFENQEEYIKYKRSSLAIVELKEQLIRCDDINLRAKLFEYIVTSCSISKDYNALLDILKLFYNRFRNTDELVFNRFLRTIHNKIKLYELSDEHWKYIHEIILMQDIRNLRIYSPIVLEYSKYLYKNGQDFSKMVTIYLQAENVSLRNDKFQDGKFKDVKFQKEFLKLALKQNRIEKSDNRISVQITLAIKDWNRKHPNDFILVSDNKEIIGCIKKYVDVDWLYHESDESLAMKYLICRENVFKEFENVYFNRMETLENVTISKWMLKYKPDIFKEHVDHVVDCLNIKTRFYLMKFLRKYEHTGLVDTISRYYLKKLIDINEEDKDKIAHLLASIMPKSDFLRLLDENVPKCDKLDLTTANLEEKNIHKVQVALATSVRYSTCQAEALPILLKYCRGDYFQPSLYSLYSCFNRIPEKSLVSVMDYLLEKPVSVRKHSIFLAAAVFPLKTNKELSQKILENDKNDSIKKHLFTSTYKYFLKNPLEEFWKPLGVYMDHLTSHEKESLNLLSNIHVIPENYRGSFMKKVCNVFDNLELKEKTPMNVYYDKLMESVKDDDIRLLPQDLCVDIIGKRLFADENIKDSPCIAFTIKFLMYAPNTRENVQSVLKIMDRYKKQHSSTSFGKDVKFVIHKICKNIFNKTMRTKAERVPISANFPAIISEEWKKVFSMDDTLEEHLMLDFMILKCKNKKDENFYALEITKMFRNLRDEYGDLITGFFTDFLSMSLNALLTEEFYVIELMRLLAKMHEIDPSLPNSLLIIQLLPQFQHDIEFENNFNDVIKKVQSASRIENVYMHRYFKK